MTVPGSGPSCRPNYEAAVLQLQREEVLEQRCDYPRPPCTTCTPGHRSNHTARWRLGTSLHCTPPTVFCCRDRRNGASWPRVMPHKGSRREHPPLPPPAAAAGRPAGRSWRGCGSSGGRSSRRCGGRRRRSAPGASPTSPSRCCVAITAGRLIGPRGRNGGVVANVPNGHSESSVPCHSGLSRAVSPSHV